MSTSWLVLTGHQYDLVLLARLINGHLLTQKNTCCYYDLYFLFIHSPNLFLLIPRYALPMSVQKMAIRLLVFKITRF